MRLFPEFLVLPFSGDFGLDDPHHREFVGISIAVTWFGLYVCFDLGRERKYR